MNIFDRNITYRRRKEGPSRTKRKTRTKRRRQSRSEQTGGAGATKLQTMNPGSFDGLLSENEQRIIAINWDIESYRSPADTLALWNLKKWFMELHKECIPEDELVPLAQAFANNQAYGCVYPVAMMQRLEELGEPIARIYQNLRSTKSVRHLVPAGKAALLELQQVPYEQHYAALVARQTANLRPVIPARRLADIFQNIVVVNNSLKDTVQWLERLGAGTISIAMCPLMYKTFEVKAYADHFFITKAAGPYKQAYANCVTNLMEILKWYCYQVNYRRNLDVSEYNVERLVRADLEEANAIDSNNLGYRMLKKLGWTGEAGLGSHQQGIVKPIEVERHNDRRGLGSSYKWPRSLRGLRRLHAECQIDILFYQRLMEMFIRRKPYYDLIFSPEFTKAERILLARMAGSYRIRCETRETLSGTSQFVLVRYPFPPHEILVQVLIHEHPLFKKFYEVIPPKLCLVAKS